MQCVVVLLPHDRITVELLDNASNIFLHTGTTFHGPGSEHVMIEFQGVKIVM